MELSAHSFPAADHEPVQGRAFENAEFSRMQSGQPCRDIDGNLYAAFERPIGEWNCQHLADPFAPGVSERRCKDE